MTEAQLHKNIVDWLCLAKPDCFWTTIEHGSSGFKRQAKLKRMGVIGGLPDMMFIHDGLVFFIELKRSNKDYPSPQQKACHRFLRSFGSHVAICRSLAEVQGTLAAWGMVRAA